MEDVYEANNVESYQENRSVMDMTIDRYNNIYHRNWRLYLDSIEWDTWCKHETEEEKEIRRKKIEIETHPFKNFF